MNVETLALTGELAESLARPTPGPSALDLAHGFHEGIQEEQYHRKVLGLASKHALDLIGDAPAAYRAWVDAPHTDADDTEALIIGRAVHCAALEPDRFLTAYACEPSFGDCRKSDNRARRDEWRAARAGAVLLTEAQFRDVSGMARAVRAHPRVAALLALGARAEVTARWADRTTGLECKARADLWCPGLDALVDLKSTLDASADAFSRTVENFGYQDQAAMYCEGWSALDADVQFIFIAVNKRAPYLCAVYGLDDPWMVSGARRIARRMRRLAECIERDDWPGYPVAIQTLERPKWARD